MVRQGAGGTGEPIGGGEVKEGASSGDDGKTQVVVKMMIYYSKLRRVTSTKESVLNVEQLVLNSLLRLSLAPLGMSCSLLAVHSSSPTVSGGCSYIVLVLRGSLRIHGHRRLMRACSVLCVCACVFKEKRRSSFFCVRSVFNSHPSHPTDRSVQPNMSSPLPSGGGPRSGLNPQPWTRRQGPRSPLICAREPRTSIRD